MDLFNTLIESLGKPVLFLAVLFMCGRFMFKEKKPMHALGALIAGGLAYYVMTNIDTVLNGFSTVATTIIDFIKGLFTGKSSSGR